MKTSTVCAAIFFDARTINGVAKATGIAQSSLQRFCAGERGMQLSAFEKACQILDLELVRFVDIGEYCEENWEEERQEIQYEQYDQHKEVEWDIYEKEAWEEHVEERWIEQKREFIAEFISASGYQPTDAEGLEQVVAEAHESWISELDENEWSENEYSDWSSQYDDTNYDVWKDEAFENFREREKTRLSKIEWIVLTGVDQ